MTTLRNAVFIDRDGVIIKDRDYVYKSEDLSFIPGSLEALQTLSRTSYKIIIITNQSGIGRGYFTESDYHVFTETFFEKLSSYGARVDGVYFCPHHPASGIGRYGTLCACRKPKTGMITKASHEHGIRLKGSWLIGDKTSDIKAGATAGCKTILVKTGYAGQDRQCRLKSDLIAKDLFDAVRMILVNGR
ncbi:MAG: D-glycero-beta-D-manno-heptose 1,7-bisphosphate 7-phosphatase [Thermodesulfobacteriota bacterium]